MAVNIVKPSANNTTGTVGGTNANIPSAYDLSTGNDLTTASTHTASVSAVQTATKIAQVQLTTVPALPVQTYTAKILKVNWAISTYSDPGGLGPTYDLSYSINSGSTFSPFPSGATPAQAVGSGQCWADLGVGQDVTAVQVRASSGVIGDGVTAAMIVGQVYDAWIEGTFGGGGGSGKKAAAALSC